MSFADPDETDDEPPADADEADAETTASPADTVELEWAAESEAVPDGELPLDEAIKANAQVLRGKADDFALERLEEEIDSLAGEIGELREERNDLRAEVEELRATVEAARERLDSLEGWKGNVIRKVDETDENIRMLITATDVEGNGNCPKCDGGTLEKVTGFGQDNRIECGNDDCGHVAAKLE